MILAPTEALFSALKHYPDASFVFSLISSVLSTVCPMCLTILNFTMIEPIHLPGAVSLLGKEKIKVLLELEGINLSVSSVGRIILELKKRKAIPEVRYKTRWKGTRKQKHPYAIRKPKGYLVENPGDIVQADTLDIHPFPAIHFKHFTARDVVSRWDVLAVYPRARSRQAKAFLNQLIKRTLSPSERSRWTVAANTRLSLRMPAVIWGSSFSSCHRVHLN